MMKKLLLCILLFAPALSAQQWSGIISTGRAINWANAGVVGGIPTTLTQCGATIAAYGTSGTPASPATINNAISATGSGYTTCTPPYYIQLGAGTFYLNAGIIWSARNHVELRGMGANSTFVIFSGDNSCQGVFSIICMQSSDTNYAGAPSNTANWTAGYSVGTTSITLSSVANLQVGWPLTLDQNDNSGATPATGIFICTVTGQCAANGSGGAARTGRDQQQIVIVTSISGSGPYTVGISPGLYMPNWCYDGGSCTSSAPGAWWPTGPTFYDGVRDLSITQGTSGADSMVGMFNCVNCYAYRIRSVGPPGRSHVQMFQSAHITIAQNYFYLTVASASVNYGVETFPASDCLVENNIFEGVQAAYLGNGTASGCVFDYNYDVNEIFGGAPWWQNHGGFLHAIDDNTLFEGNLGAGQDWDYTHGSHHFNTAFRNVNSGFQQNQGNLNTNNLVPLMIDGIDRYANAIGNILGNPSLPNQCYMGCATAQGEILSIGSGQGDIPDDPFALTSVMLWGNCDFFNNNCRFNSSEVPTTVSPYGNTVPASHTLPASFFYSSQPSWWSSAIPWPFAGPDVTSGTLMICMSGVNKAAYITSSAQCPSGTTNNLLGWANPNPATACYLNTMGGSPIGTDTSALAFNASTCYGTAAPPPAPAAVMLAIKVN